MDISVFIDESGSIPKCGTTDEDFYVISMVFTDDAFFVKKIFKKSRLKAIKNTSLYTTLVQTGEIKGTDVSETLKNSIYKTLIDKCSDKFEIGIILIDNNKLTDGFRQNCSRVFNYLIKLYLHDYFKRFSKYKDCDSIILHIDERNVSTGARFTLCEYLNTELNCEKYFCKSESDIGVTYHDSKSVHLLQLTDFISNTYYRYHKKHIKESNNTVLLEPILCNKRIYKYPLY